MLFPRLGTHGWKEADENLLLATLLTGDPVLNVNRGRGIGRPGGHGTALAPKAFGAVLMTGLFTKIAEARRLICLRLDLVPPGQWGRHGVSNQTVTCKAIKKPEELSP